MKNTDSILNKILKNNKHLKVLDGGKQTATANNYQKQSAAANRNGLEDLFHSQFRALGLDKLYELSHDKVKFHPTRKWRFDFAIENIRLAIEIEGGTRNLGRHSRHEGYQSDCHKYNEAQRLGWVVLRFTSEDVKSGHAIDYLEKFLREYHPRPLVD